MNIVYFITTLIYNSVLATIYLLLVLTEHPDCLTKSGANIATNLEFAFMLGLLVLSADIINSNFMSIYFRR